MSKIGFNFFRDPGRATLSTCKFVKRTLKIAVFWAIFEAKFKRFSCNINKMIWHDPIRKGRGYIKYPLQHIDAPDSIKAHGHVIFH